MFSNRQFLWRLYICFQQIRPSLYRCIYTSGQMPFIILFTISGLPAAAVNSSRFGCWASPKRTRELTIYLGHAVVGAVKLVSRLKTYVERNCKLLFRFCSWNKYDFTRVWSSRSKQNISILQEYGVKGVDKLILFYSSMGVWSRRSKQINMILQEYGSINIIRQENGSIE